jgi:Poly(A) polymerase central domain
MTSHIYANPLPQDMELSAAMETTLREFKLFESIDESRKREEVLGKLNVIIKEWAHQVSVLKVGIACHLSSLTISSLVSHHVIILSSHISSSYHLISHHLIISLSHLSSSLIISLPLSSLITHLSSSFIISHLSTSSLIIISSSSLV